LTQHWTPAALQYNKFRELCHYNREVRWQTPTRVRATCSFREVDPDTLPLMPSGFADRSQSAMIGASLSPLVESFIQ
jgi:hypothetical protein